MLIDTQVFKSLSLAMEYLGIGTYQAALPVLSHHQATVMHPITKTLFICHHFITFSGNMQKYLKLFLLSS